MRLIFPNNIFSTLFILSMDEKERKGIEIKDAPFIVEELNSNVDSVGLIPSFDLINHRDLFISDMLSISMEGLLSNSYIYFNSENADINKLFLRGDISTNEVILSKIVFQERYNIVPEIVLDSKDSLSEVKNYLITGNENWVENNFRKGTSFSEQISELIEFPYVNFIFASKDEKSVKKFKSKFENMHEKIIQNTNDNLDKIGMDETVNDFIINNLDSVQFRFSENTLALSELFKLAYYHQIIDDIFDIKFV